MTTRSLTVGVAKRPTLAVSPSITPTLPCRSRRRLHVPQWRPVSVLDEWVAKEARPISLRQLMVFGRSLTESRLLSSANYVRTELPTRLAHRIRDMQRLPYVVVSNPHIQDVYALYYHAFETFRKIREITTLDSNDAFCATITQTLRAHLTVIPKLSMGALQCADLMDPALLDTFMNTILRSRISRRTIAEQHLSLTETFNAPWFSPGAKLSPDAEFIGEVFLRCVARDVVEKCGHTVHALARAAYGPGVPLPEIKITGHLEANFPYILSHLQYIVGELLRNSVTAVVEKNLRKHTPQYPLPPYAHDSAERTEIIQKLGEMDIPKPHPIEVTICESAQHVTVRVSDRGGGIEREELPYLWSFGKSPSNSGRRLENLGQVPKMAATLAELGPADGEWASSGESEAAKVLAAEKKSYGQKHRHGHEHHGHGRVPGAMEHERQLEKGNLHGNGIPNKATTSQEKDADKGKKRELTHSTPKDHPHTSSLSSLSSRPPHLRLGMGLPLSRVYAEYWAGNLELHSLEGYGVDVFLQISKLGNKNEQLVCKPLPQHLFPSSSEIPCPAGVWLKTRLEPEEAGVWFPPDPRGEIGAGKTEEAGDGARS